MTSPSPTSASTAASRMGSADSVPRDAEAPSCVLENSRVSWASAERFFIALLEGHHQAFEGVAAVFEVLELVVRSTRRGQQHHVPRPRELTRAGDGTIQRLTREDCKLA